MADTGISSAELHNVAPTAMLHAAVSTEPEPDGAGPPAAAVASTGGPAAPAVAAQAGEEAAPEMPAMLGLPAAGAAAGPPRPPEPGRACAW